LKFDGAVKSALMMLKIGNQVHRYVANKCANLKVGPYRDQGKAAIVLAGLQQPGAGASRLLIFHYSTQPLLKL
jgi:hypothetical protein